MPLTKLLQSAGWPTDTLVLDFETYFNKEYSLKNLSTSEYIYDERFEVLGLAYKRNDEAAWFIPSAASWQWALKQVVQTRTILMHNAHFDALILHKLGIHCPYVLDTRMMSRHVYARRPRHSLKALADAYNLPAKGDTMEFLGVHATDDLTELAKYAKNDAEITYQLALRLAPLISRPAMELWLMNHTLNLFLNSPFVLDVEKANRIQELMDRKLQRDLKRAGTTTTEVNSAAKLQARLESLGVKVPMKRGKKKENPCFSKQDPEYPGLLHHENHDVRVLMQAREASKTWPTQIKRIETFKKQAACRGGNLPVYLNYYGAGPGRWSGGDGTNLQNLSVRGGTRLRRQIRGLICAPLGHSLVVVDSSQIEARGVDWISDQLDYLDLWRHKALIYELFAVQLYGGRVEDITGTQRSAGKTGILGAGYGMGADRCVDYARTTFKIILNLLEADRLIQLYRKTHAEVVKFWYAIDHAFKFVVCHHTTKELAGGRLQIAWVPGEKIISIRLPNGRKLYYHHPRLTTKGGQTELRTDEHAHLWGGVLTENVVQAISRDVLAENIYTLEHMGIPVSLHVHDEVVMCVPTEQADDVLKQALEVFSQSPTWAADWPLGGAGKVMPRYGK